MSDDVRHNPDQPESDEAELTRPTPNDPADDAIEAEAASAAAASDTFEQAGGVDPEPEVETLDATENATPEPEPAGKPERLQKILAQAGIASRRHAEELITEGRVQVNGKVVTELGTKADPARDHIRVDGKLLQGSERQRYFMLNKPKGFVTTVSDPEGRPTIMQFFTKMRERLYPVGRLDYLSEGLLLVTNDGELANKLTRAASGVEKTYLVKVSGHPSEEEIERLREGVSIDRVKPGSGRVQSTPAQIRKVRHGDNPWYEVVLIEGRNRELRKMFEEIGHHVEKIRRVGYGPLVLDLEPGNVRELEPEEVEDLRKAAEGKYRKKKTRDAHKRSAAAQAQLPTVKPRWSPRHGGEAGRDRSSPHRPERRPEPGGSRDRNRSASRGQERGPNRGPIRGPERGPTRRPGSLPPGGQFRTQPRGNFRPDARFEAGRSQRPPRRDAPERPVDEVRDNRGRSAQFPSRERGTRPAWKNKPGHGSAPPRFDREARSERAGPRPNRPGDRRQPGEFRSAPPSGRGPQRFAGKPASGPGGFSGRKRLEISPADEDFGGRQSRPQDSSERRPFPPRGGPRQGPGRGSSGPRFTGKQRPQSDRDRQQDSLQRPRFDRDREERPRSDRPKPGARVKPPAGERPDRPASGPRPGGFKRGGPGGRGRNSSPNRGSMRSGGGRRPGSRPGGKSGGGKRRP